MRTLQPIEVVRFLFRRFLGLIGSSDHSYKQIACLLLQVHIIFITTAHHPHRCPILFHDVCGLLVHTFQDLGLDFESGCISESMLIWCIASHLHIDQGHHGIQLTINGLPLYYLYYWLINHRGCRVLFSVQTLAQFFQNGVEGELKPCLMSGCLIIYQNLLLLRRLATCGLRHKPRYWVDKILDIDVILEGIGFPSLDLIILYT